jgi:hypothetical protein
VTDLPPWIYDVVMAMQHWSDVHPKLHGDFHDGICPMEDDCGCKALDLVPAEVKAQAQAIRAYMQAMPHMVDIQDKINELAERMAAERRCTTSAADLAEWHRANEERP